MPPKAEITHLGKKAAGADTEYICEDCNSQGQVMQNRPAYAYLSSPKTLRLGLSGECDPN